MEFKMASRWYEKELRVFSIRLSEFSHAIWN